MTVCVCGWHCFPECSYKVADFSPEDNRELKSHKGTSEFASVVGLFEDTLSAQQLRSATRAFLRLFLEALIGSVKCEWMIIIVHKSVLCHVPERLPFFFSLFLFGLVGWYVHLFVFLTGVIMSTHFLPKYHVLITATACFGQEHAFPWLLMMFLNSICCCTSNTDLLRWWWWVDA